MDMPWVNDKAVGLKVEPLRDTLELELSLDGVTLVWLAALAELEVETLLAPELTREKGESRYFKLFIVVLRFYIA